MADDGVTEQLDDNAALFWLNKQLAAVPAGGAKGSVRIPRGAELRAESFVDLADGTLLLALVRRISRTNGSGARTVRATGRPPVELPSGVAVFGGVCGRCQHACGRAMAACTRVVQPQGTRADREVP
jgi:hypothetical protein